MGKRAPRRRGCRVGTTGGRNCGQTEVAVVTMLCPEGHRVSMWLCKRHYGASEKPYLVCKVCLRKKVESRTWRVATVRIKYGMVSE